jgi:hypothetical protein
VPWRIHFFWLIAIGALALGACGDAKPASKTTTVAAPAPAVASTAEVEVASDTAAPATGDRIAGTGYEFRSAKGWYDIRKTISPDSDVTLGTTHGSVLNIEYSQRPQALKRGAGLAKMFTDVVIDVGHLTRLKPSTPIEVDGATGLSTQVRVKTDQGTAPARVVVLVHGEDIYAIVASSSPKEPSPTAGDFAAMLSSWRWT